MNRVSPDSLLINKLLQDAIDYNSKDISQVVNELLYDRYLKYLSKSENTEFLINSLRSKLKGKKYSELESILGATSDIQESIKLAFSIVLNPRPIKRKL